MLSNSFLLKLIVAINHKSTDICVSLEISPLYVKMIVEWSSDFILIWDVDFDFKNFDLPAEILESLCFWSPFRLHAHVHHLSLSFSLSQSLHLPAGSLWPPTKRKLLPDLCGRQACGELLATETDYVMLSGMLEL